MRARLLYREKFIYADGAIREMVLWQLPLTSVEKTAALKYRLFYGTADGTGLLRYDNEKGKGHHRHALDLEEPYRFTDVDTLVKDFLEDIERMREMK
jgi:hypothetical protein